MSTTAPSPAAAPAPATPPAADAPVDDPAARIGALREQIDACDAGIIDLVRRRLVVSREIGALRAASGGTRLSLSRESQVLARFRSALGDDGATLALMLLRQGRGRL